MCACFFFFFWRTERGSEKPIAGAIDGDQVFFDDDEKLRVPITRRGLASKAIIKILVQFT